MPIRGSEVLAETNTTACQSTGPAAAWATYIVGKAATVYFSQGGWGGGGAKAILRDILSGVDRDSVLDPLKEELQRRLASGKA